MQLNGPQTKQTSKWQSIYGSLYSSLLQIACHLGIAMDVCSVYECATFLSSNIWTHKHVRTNETPKSQLLPGLKATGLLLSSSRKLMPYSLKNQKKWEAQFLTTLSCYISHCFPSSLHSLIKPPGTKMNLPLGETSFDHRFF